ncbi:unnamed protein product, partial [marine sediment metagenome]
MANGKLISLIFNITEINFFQSALIKLQKYGNANNPNKPAISVPKIGPPMPNLWTNEMLIAKFTNIETVLKIFGNRVLPELKTRLTGNPVPLVRTYTAMNNCDHIA